MTRSKATKAVDYLKELPDDRRTAIDTIRNVIKKNIDKGFSEGMQYGMIAWSIPHKTYPAGYHADPEQPVPFLPSGRRPARNSTRASDAFGSRSSRMSHSKSSPRA